MSKSKATIAAELLEAFMCEIDEVVLLGDDDSFERKESMNHLLNAKDKVQRMFQLFEQVERSGSLLPYMELPSVESKVKIEPSDVKKSIPSATSKFETCVEKLSNACKLLTETTTRPVSASGYGGAAGSGAMQFLSKNMDLTKWKGEEAEPWENVEARVIDAA